MNDRVTAQGEVIYDALRRLVRRMLARKTGGHLVQAGLDEIDIHLHLALKGRRAEADVFAQELAATIGVQIDEAIEQAAAFRPGHTYCHRCSGSSCEHSQPPDSRHVFVGYAPVGTPLWVPFPQYCLDMKHPDVQGLYGSRPSFLTLSQDADTLRGELLDAWRNPTYDLLAQLVAGYFRVPSRPDEGPGVLALTFQVTGWRTASRRLRLGLNVLGRTPAGEDLGLLWERSPDLPWRRAINWAQVALAGLPAPSRTSSGKGGKSRRREPVPAALDERVAGILGGLARRLEREQRGQSRRTNHAQRRHAAGDRPTRQAMDDVLKVRPQDILVDERSGVLVILGQRGRTHFLTPEGRLVSSVRYSREAIERKRKQGRWHAASPEEAQEFLSVLQASQSEASES